MSSKPTSSKFQTNRIAYADHTLSTDIDSLINKVNLNSAFLNLSRNDSELVNDMKAAIVQLYTQSKKRETLYIAIEHNTKYLTTMSKTIETERDAAVIEVAALKKEVNKIKSDTDTMKRKFTSLMKDSEQLVQERKKITQLTLDVTKAKEKEEAATQNLKDAKKKLSKAEKELVDVTADRDDFTRKAEFL